MLLLAKFLLIILFLIAVTGCAPQGWSQFHADSSNGGFVLANSNIAFKPKWSVHIGSVSFSSPVIGGDGTIYVGTELVRQENNIVQDGQLVAVFPNGSIKWRNDFTGSSISSSPAIGNDGNIYVISTQKINNEYKSTLHSISADNGSLNRSFVFPGGNISTLASPKIWGTGRDLSVFIPAHDREGNSSLYIFNPASSLIHIKPLCGAVIEGGSVNLDDWWKIFTLGLPFDFHTEGIDFFILAPSVAITDASSLNLINRPIIVAADNSCGLQAFQWNPQDQTLKNLWSHYSDSSSYSSPVIFPASEAVAVGRKDGQIFAYDIFTGAEQWRFDTNGDARPTPASVLGGAGEIFAATQNRFYALDDYGQLIRTFDLPAKELNYSSPAVSANYTYISASSGMYSFSFDLSSYAADGTVEGGLSSPAIADNGTVYLVTFMGDLIAYPK